MALVCLDTQIVIWAIKEEATLGQEDMIPRAQEFLLQLDKQKANILLPTVVVSDLLLPIPQREHGAFVKEISKRFLIAPYDMSAALLYARIWQDRYDEQIVDELLNEGNTKGYIKANCMIVAIAIAQNADCIYSHDRSVHKFAEGKIKVANLPDSPSQRELFKLS
jgi:predicted nucleic acid-binding protein